MKDRPKFYPNGEVRDPNIGRSFLDVLAGYSKSDDLLSVRDGQGNIFSRSPNTVTVYKGDAGLILECLRREGVPDIRSVRQKHVDTLPQILHGLGYKPATVIRYLAGARHFLTWTQAEGITATPLNISFGENGNNGENGSNTEIPPLPFFTPQAIESVLEEAKAVGPDSALLVWGIMQGPRLSQLINTNIEDFDYRPSTGTVLWRIRNREGEFLRTMEMQQPGILYVAELVQGRNGAEPLFLSFNGSRKRLSKSTAGDLIRDAVRLADVGIQRPESLRFIQAFTAEDVAMLAHRLCVNTDSAKNTHLAAKRTLETLPDDAQVPIVKPDFTVGRISRKDLPSLLTT